MRKSYEEWVNEFRRLIPPHPVSGGWMGIDLKRMWFHGRTTPEEAAAFYRDQVPDELKNSKAWR